MLVGHYRWENADIVRSLNTYLCNPDLWPEAGRDVCGCEEIWQENCAAPGPTWVIEVVLALQRLRLLVRRQDSVEAVLAHDSHLPLAVVHLVLAQELHDLGANCWLWQKNFFQLNCCHLWSVRELCRAKKETVCGGAELTEVHEWSSSCGVYHLTLGLTLRGN